MFERPLPRNLLPDSSLDPALLAALCDALPNAILAYDRELCVVAWNATAARSTAIPRDDALGRSLLELFPHIAGTEIEADHRRALAGETVEGRDRRWILPGEVTPRWFDVLYAPVRGPSGDVTGGIVFTTDISARREAEGDLARERLLLRTVVDSPPMGMIAFDSSLRVTEWNAYAERTTGLRRAAALGRPLVDVVPGLVGSEVMRDYERALAGDTVHVRNRWYAVPRGAPRCYDAVFAPMRDGRGIVTGGVMLATDVTERAEAEAERDRLIAIVEATPDVVGIGDASARSIIYINHAGRELLGVGSDERDLRVEDFVAQDDVGFVFGTVVPAAQRHGVWRGEFRLRGREGRVFPMSAVVVAHRDASGETAYFSAIFRDVSADKRREAELAAARAAAERASGAKSSFLAGMSHELRTPLGAVIGFAQLVRAGHAGPLTETQREYLDDVLVAARHLRSVVDDALDLALIEAGVVDVRPQPVDMAAVVGEAVVTVAGLAAEREVTLEQAVEPSARRVVTDPARVRQVLLNYLSNAIKYNRPGGRARVEVARADDGQLRLTVRDTGRGIAADDLARLFVEFQRLGVHDIGGSGLGLAVTKRVVEAMGGSVRAESTPGAGSAFHALLPLAPAPAQAPDDSAPAARSE